MWRLSCGCLRAYPGMPTTRAHCLLCVACRTSVVTLYAYPDRRCGVRGVSAQNAVRVQVSCTNLPGNTDCEGGVHYDQCALAKFEAAGAGALRAGSLGQTGRA